MKIVDKNIRSLVIEITAYEINQQGFYKIWDEIRLVYPAKEYELDNIKESHDGKILLLTLRSLKFYYLLDN